jgi:short subunit dehydrogenase-like uncharacterized protein
MTARGPIAVYGATGYTGNLVARELARRGLPFVLAGRSGERLARVAEAVGTDAPVRVAAVDELRALRRCFEDCAAVINCAGPFTHYGETVVRAAIESATHYVDTTGEQPFMKLIADRYDEAARAAEVAVVPAMGFDYVPGDLLCGLAARGHEPLRELVIAYSVAGFGATRGTLRSALEILKGGDFVYEEGDWRPAGMAPVRASFTFPEPIGRQPVARYPSGEVVTVPRHVRTRKVTSLMSARAFAPHPALARLVPLTMPGLSLALRTPLSSVLSAAIGRLPEGPAEDDRRSVRWEIVALAHGEDGTTGSGVVRGSDPYGLTGVTSVYGAALMAGEGYDRAGVLAPSTAYDAIPFLNFLGDHGVSYEIDGARSATAEPVGTS